MNIERIIEHPEFVELAIRGELTLPGLTDVYRRAHDECVRKGIRGALVDLTAATGTLTAHERAELVTTLDSSWDRRIVVATVLNDEQFLPSRFGQLVAQNRGIRTVEFKDRNHAVGWIMSALAPQEPDEPQHFV